jgi:hypothetical protein
MWRERCDSFPPFSLVFFKITGVLMLNHKLLYAITCFIPLGFMSVAGAQDYDIGAYYYYNPTDTYNNFGYDYAMMDLARHGCTKLFVSGNSLVDPIFWATVRNWNMKGATAYNILNGLGTNPVIDDGAIAAGIQSEKNLADNLNYMGTKVGDAVIGKMIQDEVECGGLSTGQQNYLIHYCQQYRLVDPNRQTYINHCDPPWYNLGEDRSTCSTGPTIYYNRSRITARISAAQATGHQTFTAVAQVNRIADWMDRNCANINYYGFGPCTMSQISWLASRTTYQDTVEEVNTPYIMGADGVMAYQYGDNTPGSDVWSLVDVNGNDPQFKMKGYGDGAYWVRAQQGWPTVGLYRYVGRRMPVMPIYDRRKYPAGTITLAATYSGTPAVQTVEYGMSTTGGASWTTQSLTPGINATFTLTAGTTVILRARSTDTQGRQSIWTAYMIYVVDPSQLECGDYESGLIAGDINKDCRVTFSDIASLGLAWITCDDPNRPECGAWDNQHQFYCGQIGSGHPGITGDINGDCTVNIIDFARVANDWFKCDDPVTTNCP